MYKEGKYEYKSKEHYQRLLISVGVAFLASVFALIQLKANMSVALYNITVTISIMMIFHLSLRFALSKNWISKYPLNEY